MTLRVVLRGVAVTIAILGTVDPVVMRERPIRRTVVIAAQAEGAGGSEGPRHGTALGNAAWAAAAALGDQLADDFDVSLHRLSATDRAAACAPEMPCVLVGEDRWAGPLGDGQSRVVGAVRIAPAAPHLRIVNAAVTALAHESAVGRLQVELNGVGVVGGRSVVDVLDSGVPIGQAVHEWTSDGRAAVDIEWWPMASGLRRLTVRATGIAADGVVDDGVDLGVPVSRDSYPVLVYDPRPSWTSTFVRRAIERDPRVSTRLVAKLGPQLQVSSGAPFRLDQAALAAASAVVIGALDQLSAAEVELLDRFVRIRGGSLILVPDRRPTGAVMGLLSSPVTERLEAAPVRVGDWRATELLVFRTPPAGASILSRVGDDAVVVSTPVGNGRVVVAGAMDAWRYRDVDDAAFDRAWQSLIADAAAAGGRTLNVTADRPLARPGEEIRLDVRLRAMADADAAVGVSATVACGTDAPRVLRLWPTADRRRFEGRVSATDAVECRVAVSSTEPVVASGTADLRIATDVGRPLTRTTTTLAQAVAAAGGRVVAPGDEATTASDVRRLLPVELASAVTRPMRSVWWIVPFAACLGLEWWLRRRHGLR